MQSDKPFQALSRYGNNFLTKFEGAEVPSPILRNVTLIDTPGVLSGEKQRMVMVGLGELQTKTQDLVLERAKGLTPPPSVNRAEITISLL